MTTRVFTVLTALMVLISGCDSSPSLPEGADQSLLSPSLKILAVTPDSIRFEISARDRNREVGVEIGCGGLRVQRLVEGEWIAAGLLSQEQGEELNCGQPLILLRPGGVLRLWESARASLVSETVPVRISMQTDAGVVVTEPIVRE